MRKILALAAACLLLTSCAAVGPQYSEEMIKPPRKGMSQLVFYFPNAMNGVRPMKIKVGERECDLYANGFMTFSIKPGDVTVGINDDSDEIPAEGGQTEFIKVYANPAKRAAATNFGLVGLLVYTAVKHGTKENADTYFDVIEEDIAREEIDDNKMHKSPGCSKAEN